MSVGHRSRSIVATSRGRTIRTVAHLRSLLGQIGQGAENGR